MVPRALAEAIGVHRGLVAEVYAIETRIARDQVALADTRAALAEAEADVMRLREQLYPIRVEPWDLLKPAPDCDPDGYGLDEPVIIEFAPGTFIAGDDHHFVPNPKVKV